LSYRLEEPDPRLGSITRTQERGVTTFTVRGEATAAGFMTAFRGFLCSPTPGVLWDLRGCSLSRFPLDELRSLVSRLMRSGVRKRAEGRSAFVCSGSDDQNIARILIAYAEASEYPVRLALFPGVEGARRWLTPDLPPDS
jgi:hypothetical protein